MSLALKAYQCSADAVSGIILCQLNDSRTFLGQCTSRQFCPPSAFRVGDECKVSLFMAEY